jgi:hypothetical protein
MIRVNYLNNKELLSEIHKSKNSFSYYIENKYQSYDCIVTSLNDITEELIQQVKEKKALQAMQEQKIDQKSQGLKNHQIKLDQVVADDINVEDITWRVMTFEHIPLDNERSKNPISVADFHKKLIFLPFKHYIIRDGEFVEVGRSHWKNGLHNGHFSQEHGKISNKLALMFMKLVERYSQRSNWRGYTYVDEMRSQALLQLSLVGLQFDESRSDNPFAYYTVTVSNAFTRILNLEKTNQNIRDDILIMSGVAPSMTRQIDNELAQKVDNNHDEPTENLTSTTDPVTNNVVKPKRGAFGKTTMWEPNNRQSTKVNGLKKPLKG